MLQVLKWKHPHFEIRTIPVTKERLGTIDGDWLIYDYGGMNGWDGENLLIQYVIECKLADVDYFISDKSIEDERIVLINKTKKGMYIYGVV